MASVARYCCCGKICPACTGKLPNAIDVTISGVNSCGCFTNDDTSLSTTITYINGFDINDVHTLQAGVFNTFRCDYTYTTPGDVVNVKQHVEISGCTTLLNSNDYAVTFLLRIEPLVGWILRVNIGIFAWYLFQGSASFVVDGSTTTCNFPAISNRSGDCGNFYDVGYMFTDAGSATLS